MKPKRIGFIGNFIPFHSTENDRKWSFEQLGHTVIPFQENKTTTEELLSAITNLDLLVYSHTHDPSYVIPHLREVFIAYKAAGIPTASAHLDRWAWLDRVKDVGTEATWFTEYIFMADGSPEAVELYEKLNLNWYYLRPAVVERDCYIAEPNHAEFPHEIIFTGSKGYHPEYAFRPQLVNWLKSTYGNKFGHYGNDGIRVLRGHNLNVAYATAKVVVGDSCFGGRPYYVSDRYFEVRGRGGLLLHPNIKGVDKEGVIYYKHGDFEDLKFRIDRILEFTDEYKEMRQAGFEWVKNNETYTNRAQEMLDIIFE